MSTPELPPAELAPAVPPNATPQQCIMMWMDLVDACEQFLLAGLRREIGPDGDLEVACRRWHAEQAEEHYQTLRRMADRFNQRVGDRDAG